MAITGKKGHAAKWKKGSRRKATDEIEEFYRESENEAGNRPYESPVKGHEKDHFENTSSTK